MNFHYSQLEATFGTKFIKIRDKKFCANSWRLLHRLLADLPRSITGYAARLSSVSRYKYKINILNVTERAKSEITLHLDPIFEIFIKGPPTVETNWDQFTGRRSASHSAESLFYVYGHNSLGLSINIFSNIDSESPPLHDIYHQPCTYNTYKTT